jgi:hypothetical protein
MGAEMKPGATPEGRAAVPSGAVGEPHGACEGRGAEQLPGHFRCLREPPLLSFLMARQRVGVETRDG